jgi:hypothetical protein
MGEVYRALDPRVGRDVSIKVSAEQFGERFKDSQDKLPFDCESSRAGASTTSYRYSALLFLLS